MIWVPLVKVVSGSNFFEYGEINCFIPDFLSCIWRVDTLPKNWLIGWSALTNSSPSSIFLLLPTRWYALEEIKMQNAAIAYKISNTDTELDAVKTVAEPEVKAESTSNVPLNPAEPLVAPEVKKVEKVLDDNFDDFK